MSFVRGQKAQDKISQKNAYITKPISDWSAEDVSDWLSSLELGEYAGSFLVNEITGIALTTLNDEDLKSIGVSKIGHRKKILLACNPLQSRADVAAGGKDKTPPDSPSRSTELKIKITYKGETKKIRLPEDVRFSHVIEEIRSIFSVSGKFTVAYVDHDGDMITIGNEGDWEECIDDVGRSIKLNISSSSSTSPFASPRGSSGSKSRSSSKHSSSSSSSRRKKMAIAFSVFDGLLQATLVINETGIIQYVNPAAEKSSGYSKAELVGNNIKIIMPEEFAREHDSYLANYLKTGRGSVIGKGRNVTLLTKEGMYVPVFLQVTENTSTGRRMFVGTITDAKDERKHVSMLQSVRDVLDGLANPAIAITADGLIQVFNKPAQQLWGYSLSDVVGKNVNILMPPEYSRDHDKYLSNYLTTGVPKIIGTGREVAALLKDGSIRRVHLSVSERKDSQQTIFTGVLIVRD